MTIDHAKAETILSRLLDGYLRKEYPYDQPDARPPQTPENMPKSLERGSREHALFLFNLCYWMRGGIKSHTATKALARLYDEAPEIFLLEKPIPGLNAVVLSELFRYVGLGFNAYEVAKAWMKNLEGIKRHWNGDPRTIFSGITTYEEACERLQRKGKRGFYGFQEKMVSMVTYFYMEADIIDRWHFPIPVDFHVLRTMFAHEIMIAERSEQNGNGLYTKPVLAAVRNLCQNYCIRNKIDPVTLCDAVWLYSGLMCNQHPGNQSNVGRRRGRKTEIKPVARWSPAQTRTYERTCGICTIQQTCRWCVPSAEYYIGGRIVLREERDAPPQQSFFPIL